jgi:hypothetical protein
VIARILAPQAVRFLSQITPACLEIVTRITQQTERFSLASRRFGGVFRDPLGQYAKLTSVADVLCVVVRLGVDVGEVGEQQHDRNNQDNEQSSNQCATTRTCYQITCI